MSLDWLGRILGSPSLCGLLLCEVKLKDENSTWVYALLQVKLLADRMDDPCHPYLDRSPRDPFLWWDMTGALAALTASPFMSTTKFTVAMTRFNGYQANFNADFDALKHRSSYPIVSSHSRSARRIDRRSKEY